MSVFLIITHTNSKTNKLQLLPDIIYSDQSRKVILLKSESFQFLFSLRGQTNKFFDFCSFLKKSLKMYQTFQFFFTPIFS